MLNLLSNIDFMIDAFVDSFRVQAEEDAENYLHAKDIGPYWLQKKISEFEPDANVSQEMAQKVSTNTP